MNWHPVKIGCFYYAQRGSETSRRNWVMRDACAACCRALNAK